MEASSNTYGDFSWIEPCETKSGDFDGPQIRKLISDPICTRNMTDVELSAWFSFVLVKNFLSNHKALNYIGLVEDTPTKYQEMAANMSIKVHYLHSHLDTIPENLGDFPEKQGESFHQDVKVMKDRYQGKWDIHMMADHCWCLQRDCPNDRRYYDNSSNDNSSNDSLSNDSLSNDKLSNDSLWNQQFIETTYLI